MDIIEKETVKEVPVDCNGNRVCGWGYGYNHGYRNVTESDLANLKSSVASKGVAGTGLGLGIAGTALGLLALGRNGGLGLFGGSSMPQNVNINTESVSGDYGHGRNIAPTTFEVWEKECQDTLALQKGLYDWALTQQAQRFNDRQTIDSQLFSVWKSQVDSDFGLYKSQRDANEATNQKITDSAFALYKNQRDGYDVLAKRISDLETKQAVADAVEPWRAKVLDMKINGVAASAAAGINLEAERRACADGKLVTYMNGTFYPIEVADITVGTTPTARTTYNPLCNCCCGQSNNF